VFAACGTSAPAPQKPIDTQKPNNVAPTPTYTCAMAARAIVEGTHLAADQKPSALHDIEVACDHERWPAAYVACVSAQTSNCTDPRTDEQKWHVRLVIAAASMPKTCVDYVQEIYTLAHCDRMPKASSDAMLNGLSAMLDAFNWNDMSPEQRASAEAAAATAC
jgi:hypothetical protein